MRRLLSLRGSSLRAVLAAGAVGILVVSLLVTRAGLQEKEQRLAYNMSALSWKVSETLFEGHRLLLALSEYASGRASRDDVINATELLWSRVGVLLDSELHFHARLRRQTERIESFLRQNEAAIYDSPEFSAGEARQIAGKLQELNDDLRALWIRDFLGDPDTILSAATHDISRTRTFYELVIAGCLLLLGVYMIGEIVLGQRAHAWERELRRQAMAASEAKSAFLANVSHEIRTPLNAVLGMAQELAETRLDPDQKRLVEIIMSSSEILLGTLNDVLDISRIESGRLELEHVCFDLRKTLRDCAEIHASAARRKGLQFRLRIDGSVPGRVTGDPLRLAQAVGNLLSNAVKFTREGAVTLDVRMAEGAFPEADGRPADGDAAAEGACAACRRAVVEIVVSDSGIGIDPEVRERIFSPFSQADSGTTRRYGGTGLGLAIVHGLCQRMGGSIDVQSRPGEGSRFTLRLPFEIPAGESGSAPVAEAPSAAARAASALPAPAGRPAASVGDAGPSGESGSAHDNGVEGDAAPAAGVSGSESGRGRSAPASAQADSRRSGPAARGRGAASALAAGSTGPAASDATRPLRVLVVDDSATNRFVLRRFLKDIGATIVEASNGREALERARNEEFDVILMDIQMPEMDGLTATRLIRAHEEQRTEGRHVPIFVVSANVMSHQVDEYLSGGADRVLLKPLRKPEILSALEAVLAARAA